MAKSNADRQREWRERKAAKAALEAAPEPVSRVMVAPDVEKWLGTVPDGVNPGLIATARALAATLDAGKAAHPAVAAELRRTMGAIRAECKEIAALSSEKGAGKPVSRLAELRASRASSQRGKAPR
jgi:hypothetical protein